MTTKVESKMDFRVGGAISHKMYIEGVGEMVYTAEYDEIIEPEKIAWHAEFGPLVSRVAVEFIAQGGQTKVILIQEGFPEQGLTNIVSEGFGAAFDKLERVLSEELAATA